MIVVFTEDPTALFSYPRACPDSVLKFLADLFSSRDTADFFYTSDMMILIEIVLRQLSDLSPGAGVSILLYQYEEEGVGIPPPPPLMYCIVTCNRGENRERGSSDPPVSPPLPCHVNSIVSCKQKPPRKGWELGVKGMGRGKISPLSIPAPTLFPCVQYCCAVKFFTQQTSL